MKMFSTAAIRACVASATLFPCLSFPWLECAADESAPPEAQEHGKDEGFEDLFNRKDLTGWASPYDWGEVKVVDEEILLKANKKFFLLCDKVFADFIFEGEVLMPDAESNSGFMFRCAAERNNVWGYQAEVDPSPRGWSGGLYDEARRGWLHPAKGDATAEQAFKSQGNPFKAGEWNHYRIHAEGDHLRIWVNGTLTTEVRDSMDSQGYVGIQHHGEKGKAYRFRNLRIKELSTALGEEAVLFDGKSLKGFHGDGGGKPGAGWVVDGDTIHLKEPGKGGNLFVDGNWENFELTFEWKIAEGARAGLGYRVPDGRDPGSPGAANGPVYAFLDRNGNDKAARDKRHRSGALLGVAPAADDAAPKKIGEFNQARITVYRDSITHELNGKTAVRMSTESARWKRLLKKSDQAENRDFAAGEGKIVLLDANAPVWIKKLRIRVLR